MDIPVNGHCDERFDGVRHAFIENFRSRGEVGAGVCVQVDGVTVVDLVGGWASHDRARLWEPDTLVNVYSVGKAIIGLLALQLIDSGVLALDEPIAQVWPDFAGNGKGGATIRHALCHRAGVPAIREPLNDEDLWSFETMAAALAATAPWWEPGTRHAYHTNTYGHLIGEIIRRTTNEMPSSRLRTIASDLGIADQIVIGVPEELLGRCADVDFVSSIIPSPLVSDELPPDVQMTMLSYFNPPGYSSMGLVNTTPWRNAEIPSTNLHATPRGIASLYSALLEDGRLLSAGLLGDATRAHSTGPCPILGEDVSFGLGFVPTSVRRPFGPSPESFGHFGTGGAVGFCDPTTKVAFGYAMNHVIPRWQSTRNRSLIDAVYESF